MKSKHHQQCEALAKVIHAIAIKDAHKSLTDKAWFPDWKKAPAHTKDGIMAIASYILRNYKPK